jgi:hypothetical protein
VKDSVPDENNDFGGMAWECLAVTLDDVRSLVESFGRHATRTKKFYENN